MGNLIHSAARAPTGLAAGDLAVESWSTLSQQEHWRPFVVDAIWEIVAINEGTCCWRAAVLQSPERAGQARLALLHEHEFYSAEHLASKAAETR